MLAYRVVIELNSYMPHERGWWVYKEGFTLRRPVLPIVLPRDGWSARWGIVVGSVYVVSIDAAIAAAFTDVVVDWPGHQLKIIAVSESRIEEAGSKERSCCLLLWGLCC